MDDDDDDVQRAIMAAAEWGDLPALEPLISRFQPLYQDSNGFTPLHMAINYSHSGYATALLAARANPNVATYRSGSTPLHFAAQTGRCDCLEALFSDKRLKWDARAMDIVRALHKRGRMSERALTMWMMKNRRVCCIRVVIAFLWATTRCVAVLLPRDVRVLVGKRIHASRTNEAWDL